VQHHWQVRGFRCAARRPESQKSKSHAFPLHLFCVDDEAASVGSVQASSAARMWKLKEEIVSFDTDSALHDWVDKLTRMLVLVNESAAAMVRYQAQLKECQSDAASAKALEVVVDHDDVAAPLPIVSNMSPPPTATPLLRSPAAVPSPKLAPAPLSPSAQPSANQKSTNHVEHVSNKSFPSVDVVLSQLSAPLTSVMNPASIEIVLTVWTSYGEALRLPSSTEIGTRSHIVDDWFLFVWFFVFNMLFVHRFQQLLSFLTGLKPCLNW
jgi:hypothetical protein